MLDTGGNTFTESWNGGKEGTRDWAPPSPSRRREGGAKKESTQHASEQLLESRLEVKSVSQIRNDCMLPFH